MLKSNLSEGLMLGDLDELVLPLISIDEYESKISDDNLVVAFYVRDKEPGKDLARFLSKSEIDILDAEISPVPNEEGNYLVFVEFLRDKSFIDDLLTLTDSMSGLTSIDRWEFKAYKKQLEPLSAENLKANVRLKPKGEPTKALESLLMDTRSVRLLQGNLIAGTSAFRVLAIGKTQRVMEGYSLESKPILLGETQTHRILATAFGANWQVNMFEQFILVVNTDSDESILLNQIL